MKQKDLLFLLVSVFIMAFAWILFSIIHNAITSTIPETVSIQISPISPSFNIKVIEKLKNKIKVIAVDSFENVPGTTNVGTDSAILPPLIPTPSATTSAIPTQTQQATGGAGLTL